MYPGRIGEPWRECVAACRHHAVLEILHDEPPSVSGGRWRAVGEAPVGHRDQTLDERPQLLRLGTVVSIRSCRRSAVAWLRSIAMRCSVTRPSFRWRLYVS